MPEEDKGTEKEKEFYVDRPQEIEKSVPKGSQSLGWGMENRLSQIFNPETGRTVMLAFDHGYFQGPTTGLERVDLNIQPIIPEIDVLMCTRGILRSNIPSSTTKPIVMRSSGGPSILGELSDERIAVDVEDAIRMNVAGMAVQVFIGGKQETQSIHNMTRLVDAGQKYGIPVMGVTAVGKEMERDARYFRLATRMIAELGANIVKTYYIEDGFETVTSACPVPIVMAGGKKIPVRDALKMTYRAISEGASGVDMGRNIFQREYPAAMAKAVAAIVHREKTPEKAERIYEDAAG